jgi:uncharacterized protein (DUF2147 family)
MKKIKSIIVMLFLAVTSLIAQNNQDAIIGTWETDVKDAKMEVFKSGDYYHGKLLWGNKVVEADGKSSKKDTKNPDAKLKNRNILGITNLTGLKFDGGKYLNGKIYDPPSGKTYDCKAWLENGKLHLRGYIGFSMLGQTAVWHRL